METQTGEDLWLGVAPDLAARVGEDRYRRWIQPLRFLEGEGDRIRLGVPNTFWLEWIEEKYLAVIAAVLRDRSGRDLRVSLSMDSRLFRELRERQDLILDRVGGKGAPAPSPSSSESSPESLLEVSDAGQPRPAAIELATLENFVEGPSNRLAHRACLDAVRNPGGEYNPIFIHGASGLGKTHLLRGVLHGLRRRDASFPVRYVTAEEFLTGFISGLRAGAIARFREQHRSPRVMVFDEIHLLAGKKGTQEEFLYTFNHLVDRRHQVVIASDIHPRALEGLHESLRGRFLSGLVCEVRRPERETRLAILRQRARFARAPFRDEVLEHLADRAIGNVRELIGALNLLEAHSAGGDALQLDAARRILAENLQVAERRASPAGILAAVAAHFGLSVEALTSKARQRSTTLPRQAAMFLVRKHTGRSLSEVGKLFGGRNHTAAATAVKRVEELLAGPSALALDIERIERELEK